MTADHDLRDRARALGVETSYWDVTGQYHEAADETLRAIVDVLEPDRRSTAGIEPVVVGRPGEVAVGAAAGSKAARSAASRTSPGSASTVRR